MTFGYVLVSGRCDGSSYTVYLLLMLRQGAVVFVAGAHDAAAAAAAGVVSPAAVILLVLVLSFHGGIPMVLDGIVCSSGNQFGNLCPLVAPLPVGIVYDAVFFVGPRRLLDVGVEMVVPTLTTLLSDPTFQMLGNQGPALGTIFAHQFHYSLIFFLRPGT